MLHLPKENSTAERIFRLILLVTIGISIVLIIETIALGYDFTHNIKWIMSLLLGLISHILYRDKRFHEAIHHIYFVMMIFILLPLGWRYSPLDSPFTVGYTLIIAAAACFFFRSIFRIIYLGALLVVSTGLLYLELAYPDFFPVMTASNSVVDRMVQMPLTLISMSAMLMAFANALRNKNQQLEALAITDALTGLYNRRYVYNYLNELSEANDMDKTYWIGLFDIDNFKAINDTYGHNIGDDAIRAVGDFLNSLVNKRGITGRIGGDEFIVILDRSELEMKAIVTYLTNNNGVELESINEFIQFSGGFRKFDPYEDIDNLISDADAKMYKAKQSATDHVVL